MFWGDYLKWRTAEDIHLKCDTVSWTTYLTFLRHFQFKFYINEMCILEHVTDVEIFLSNLQQKKQLISLTRYFQNCFMYIFDGHCFYESLSSSFKSVMQFSSFFFVKMGLLLRNRSWEIFGLCFTIIWRGYPAEIFMERIFYNTFCIEYATKLH